MVLVLSRPDDRTAAVVIDELARRKVRVVSFDPASFPTTAALTARSDGGAWRTEISGPDVLIPFDDIRSIWYRRPGSFQFHPDMTPVERRFANREAQMAVGGLLRTIECLWVNQPECMVSAEYKPLQLALAAKVGFTIPRTLVTNDPDSLKRFVEEC